MSLIKKIRLLGQQNPFLRKLIAYKLAPSGLFDWWFQNYELCETWEKRCRDVMACPDNEAIKRVKHAGKIKNGKQFLHNGIKIYLGSYYGPEYSQVLLRNKGVHEPQEERVFAEVLKLMPSDAIMIELGAFWGFYSMWFNMEVKDARSYLIEPDEFNLGQGKRNFKLNRMQGDFTRAFVGKEVNNSDPVPFITLDDYLKQKKIKKVHILHSDIQGYEFEMLQGAETAIMNRCIDYIFISTHSNELHYKCIDYLKNKDFQIIAEADLDNTFSEDGLIVASAPGIVVPGNIRIARKDIVGVAL